MGAMIPLLLLNSTRGGTGYVDPRPRCKCCGRILPQKNRFRRWLFDSYAGIALTTVGSVAAFMYVLGTLMAWIIDGSFIISYPRRQDTLVQYVSDQWHWIVNLLRHLW